MGVDRAEKVHPRGQIEKHVEKTRVRRAISYLLSIPRDVERLSAELEDVLQEFLVGICPDDDVAPFSFVSQANCSS